MEAYERQQALIDLYGKLAAAEQEIASGAEGEICPPVEGVCQIRLKSSLQPYL